MKGLIVLLALLAVPLVACLSYLVIVGLTKIVFIALYFCGVSVSLNVWAVGAIVWVVFVILQNIFKQDKNN